MSLRGNMDLIAERIATKEKLYNTQDVCELFSISEATVKNWIKLRKLVPDTIKNRTPLFSKEYIDDVMTNIKSNSSATLKSRRNKKFASGSFFYKDYVSKESINLQNIQSLLDFILENNIVLSEKEIRYILADCAIQLFLSKNSQNTICENFLSEYLNTNIDLGQFSLLIEDLLGNKENLSSFIKNNSEIFEYKYIYEKNEDILGLLYLSLSNLSNRKARGAYFTPTRVVEKVFSNIDLTNEKIIDPCCGSGNFLLQLPDVMDLENVYGNDIDQTSIELTRINMYLKYEPKNLDILYKNFTTSDFLKNNSDVKYQYIIGNPPWGYDFPKEELAELKTMFNSADTKNVESYDVFVEKSLSCLEKDGILFFVLPEAILNVKTHKIIRQIILDNTSIEYLEYLGNMFDKVQCPSVILKLKNTQKRLSSAGMMVKTKDNVFVINTERNVSSETFNFNMSDKEYEIYNKILNIKNKVFLKDNGIFALGIVTGNNKDFISDIKTETNEPILKGSDISKYKIKRVSNYIEFKPENFQQVAPVETYRAKEKLFYKFISNKLIFAYDGNQTLSLNSCNILIPIFENLDIKYIMAVLNSSVAQFIFQKQFNSIKVLRSHIESIPIPVCENSLQQQIINYVDELLKTTDGSAYKMLCDRIDLCVANLYNLSMDEYEYIKFAYPIK